MITTPGTLQKLLKINPPVGHGPFQESPDYILHRLAVHTQQHEENSQKRWTQANLGSLLEAEELLRGKKRAREEDDTRPSPPKRRRSLGMTAVHDRIYEQSLSPPSRQSTQNAQLRDSLSKDGPRHIQVAPSASTALRGQVPLAGDGSDVDFEPLFRAHVLDPSTTTFLRKIEEICSIGEESDSSSSFSGYSSSSSGSSSVSSRSSDNTLFSPTRTTKLYDPPSCKASVQKKKISANAPKPMTPPLNYKTPRYGKTRRRTAPEARFSRVGSKPMVVAPDSNPLSSSLATVSSGSSPTSSSQVIQKGEHPASWLDASVRHLRTARLWIDRIMWMIKVVTVVDDVQERLLRPRNRGHAVSA